MSLFEVFSALQQQLAGRYPDFPADAVQPERCPAGMTGDLTVNCFRFARFAKLAPDRMAAETAEMLRAHPDVEDAQVIKAFVNVTLRPAALLRDTAAQLERLLNAGLLPVASRRKVLIEYSAPNTNKPQHLGHVRNNVLGMSLAALLKRVGHDVSEINLVNDRGIHICKSMLAYARYGKGETPASTGIKGDHLVGNYYVLFNKVLGEELSAVRGTHPEWADRDDEALFEETELGRAARQMLRDWEAGVPEVCALWRKMNDWVFEGFDQTYRRIGIHFDHTYLESETYLLGKDVIAAGLSAGVFQKRDDGAVTVDLGKMGIKVVLRSDGTSVYMTQDIGTTLRKVEDYTPEELIWVVGDEQNLHFQMLFAIMKKLGYAWADCCFHLSYGMVNLPTGKMKSREGTVVDADDLFDRMAELASAACAERAPETPAAELAARGEIIGLGALKFMLLKFNPRTTMLFDPEASIRFEGDTGPYVQYACARIASIERKAAEQKIDYAPDKVDWSLLGEATEKKLAIEAGFYGAVLQLAAERRDVSGLVEYLLNLAKAFNQFYRECPVLVAPSPELVRARLALAAAVRRILADGLATLTISVPEVM